MNMQIEYSWWDNESDEINPAHKDELIEHALDRIAQQINRGDSSGELIYEIDDVSYRGWWEMKEND